MIDIETLLSPYGPTAKSRQAAEAAKAELDAAFGASDDSFDTFSTEAPLEPAELPRPAAGRHRAEVPLDSVNKPMADVLPIQLGRLSA